MKKLRKKYSDSNDSYLRLLYLNLLHLVIKKSIMPNIKDRSIDYNITIEVIKKTEEELKLACSDIVLTDNDKQVKYKLDEIVLEVKRIKEIAGEVRDNTNVLVGKNVIKRQKVPKEKIAEYEFFAFVTKLNDAHIPLRLVLRAKDNFYQAEYAIEKEETLEGEGVQLEVNRLKDAVVYIYENQYELAREKDHSSVELLTNTEQAIANNDKSMVSTSLRFQYFHKIGLLHHCSDENEEIIWTIENDK